MKVFGTMEISENDIKIGKMRLTKLAKEFGTPLMVFDEKNIKNRAKVFLDNFQSNRFNTRIIYASKAFFNLYLADLLDELGLYFDSVSGGEIYTALTAGVSPEKIYFHGNNKSLDELTYAIDNNIGTIVIDNDTEYAVISGLLKEKSRKVSVLLRINPSIEANTHKYIQTARSDSKFGLSINDEKTMELLKQIKNDENIDFRGFHCHIGSQIFDQNFFFEEAYTVLKFCKKVEDKLGLDIREVNLGGGFGVYYSEVDRPFKLDSFLRDYIKNIEGYLEKLNLNLETISIEPGRSLINDSGSTIYKIGGVKECVSGKKYLFVDGGMADNPRFPLYGAKYEAGIIRKMDENFSTRYTISGKCCESGDILIEEIKLPQASRGDLLIIPSTGAYTYSMSSNYNKLTRPAVVFIEDDKANLAVRRQTYEDLISNDYRRIR